MRSFRKEAVLDNDGLRPRKHERVLLQLSSDIDDRTRAENKDKYAEEHRMYRKVISLTHLGVKET